jgi:hypothetical protein
MTKKGGLGKGWTVGPSNRSGPSAMKDGANTADPYIGPCVVPAENNLLTVTIVDRYA